MIPEITEVNFPSYATLSEATVTLNDMGERTITAKVKIDGDIVPDFSYDWKVEYKGETYIHPYRKPQSSKENTSRLSVIDLTFEHWAVLELKRYFFTELTAIGSDTAVADKYIASVSLNLGDFVTAFNKVLQAKLGGKITMMLNAQYEYAPEPTTVEISYTKLWELLQKMYELYAVRWRMLQSGDKAYIFVGYNTSEVDHIFEYGFEGGLLKYEQQVQSPDITNRLLGRGGEKNLPYRYFKAMDEDNPSFAQDYDYIPELANIYFDRLRDINFRYYIQGWKDKHYSYYLSDGTITTNVSSDIHAANTKRYTSDVPWAYNLGFYTAKFDPVEYEQDTASIARYGVYEGGLADDEDIFPTIQGVVVDPKGRVDEVVAIEQVLSDDVEDSTVAESVVRSIRDCATTVESTSTALVAVKVVSESFRIKAGEVGTATWDKRASGKAWYERKLGPQWQGITEIVEWDIDAGAITVGPVTPYAIRERDGAQMSPDEMEAGDVDSLFHLEFQTSIGYSSLQSDHKCKLTLCFNNIKILSADPSTETQWAGKFDIWVKDIWGSTRNYNESDAAFADRVWKAILGDKEGDEAKVVFSTGLLSVSEDYEFTIITYAYDDTKTLYVFNDGVKSNDASLAASHGGISASYQSMWRLSLAKCDADLETLGLYVPSTQRQGSAGDFMFFTGIDMPRQYVLWAEERLNATKVDELAEVADIKPTVVVTLDKVRAYTKLGDEVTKLINSLNPGVAIRVADKRFTGDAYDTLYVQTVTLTYGQPTDKEAKMLPDIEVVLSNEVAPVQSTTTALKSVVTALHTQLGAISNVEAIVRAVGDKLYLRKDGISDRSLSPTQFFSLLTSGDFRQGRIGGAGWGLYRDANNNAVFEIDRVVLRQSLDVSNLVVHQTEWVGGCYVESAAGFTCANVTRESDSSGQYFYRCYFDQKQGTVKNMFKANDIAYSQTYSEDGAQIRFYKRLVLNVGVDYIDLSDADDGKNAPEGLAGTPQVGDAIIQYGNTTDANRQFVKIRDVVGGGYERFLEGLDSVNATGVEYYYAGKEIGSDGQMTSYRLFIGNRAEHYMEWYENQLTIKGKFLVEGNKTVEEAIAENNAEILSEASSLQGGINYARGTQEPKDVAVNCEDYTSLYNIKGLRSGDNVVVQFTLKPNGIFGLAQASVAFVYGNNLMTLYPENGGYFNCSFGPGQMQHNKKFEVQIPDNWDLERTDTIEFGISTNACAALGTLTGDLPRIEVSNLMVEKGIEAHPWVPCSADFDYLSKALKEDTTIEGGLVQTSIVKVGESGPFGQFTPRAGMNGIYNSQEDSGGGVAFFAGGDMVDPRLAPLGETPATFGVRMDGTVWAANNSVTIDDGSISIHGEDEESLVPNRPIITLNKDGLKGYDGTANNNMCVAINRDTISASMIEGISTATCNISDTNNVSLIRLYQAGNSIRTYISSDFPDSEWQCGIIPGTDHKKEYNISSMAVSFNYYSAQGSEQPKLPENIAIYFNDPAAEAPFKTLPFSLNKISKTPLGSMEHDGKVLNHYRCTYSIPATSLRTVSLSKNEIPVIVRIPWYKPEDDIFEPNSIYSWSGNFSVDIQGAYKDLGADCTTIGQNGFACVFGNNGMVQVQDEFRVTMGNYSMRLTAQGFFMSSDRGQNWVRMYPTTT